jgi:hypothetical protein
MALKPDTPYVFVHVAHQYLAVPLEYAHILNDCAVVDYDYKGSERCWKLADPRMQMELLGPKEITALIAADRMKGTTS